MIIYKATNILNGKSYIGQTIFDLEFRKRSHYSEAIKSNLPFHNALLKYKDAFIWSIIDYFETKEELDEMEFHYIKQFNTYFPNGYNMTYGGEGTHGWIPSEEIRKKIGLKQKGRIKTKKERKEIQERMLGNIPWNKGLTKAEHPSLRKISEASKIHSKEKNFLPNRKGIKFSEEHKNKIRESQQGQKNSFYGRKHNKDTIISKMSHFGKDNPFYGKTFTIEQLEKKSRNIYIITDEYGNEITIKVLTIWCKEHNIKTGNFLYYANKNKFYKGYKLQKFKKHQNVKQD